MRIGLLMRTCVLRAPEGDDDGDQGGGGAPPPKPKTFTQEEVSRIAAKEKKEALSAAREAANAEWQAKFEATQAEIAELKKANMSADERAKAEAKEREAAQARSREEHEGKLKEKASAALKRAEAAEERWKADRRNGALSTALLTGKVIGEAAADAAAVMLSYSKIDVDEAGEVTSVIYAGKAFDTLAAAAQQFLQDKPHFAQPTATGGTGTRSGGGGPRGKVESLFNLSREDLLARTLAKDAATGRK